MYRLGRRRCFPQFSAAHIVLIQIDGGPSSPRSHGLINRHSPSLTRVRSPQLSTGRHTEIHHQLKAIAIGFRAVLLARATIGTILIPCLPSNVPS